MLRAKRRSAEEPARRAQRVPRQGNDTREAGEEKRSPRQGTTCQGTTCQGKGKERDGRREKGRMEEASEMIRRYYSLLGEYDGVRCVGCGGGGGSRFERRRLGGKEKEKGGKEGKEGGKEGKEGFAFVVECGCVPPCGLGVSFEVPAMRDARVVEKEAEDKVRAAKRRIIELGSRKTFRMEPDVDAALREFTGLQQEYEQWTVRRQMALDVVTTPPSEKKKDRVAALMAWKNQCGQLGVLVPFATTDPFADYRELVESLDPGPPAPFPLMPVANAAVFAAHQNTVPQRAKKVRRRTLRQQQQPGGGGSSATATRRHLRVGQRVKLL